jgi:hypothetical protein
MWIAIIVIFAIIIFLLGATSKTSNEDWKIAKKQQEERMRRFREDEKALSEMWRDDLQAHRDFLHQEAKIILNVKRR